MALDEDERSRAARFRSPARQREFIWTRRFLRWVLSRYLGVDPATLRFTNTPTGKPRLSEPSSSEAEISFNVSHSHEIAACAIAFGRDVGVDLEVVDDGVAVRELAPLVLSADEMARFSALGAARQVAWFFRQWTRKEAYLKAVGAGLSGIPPHRVCLRQDAAGDVIVGKNGDRFLIRDVNPALGYAGAVAAAGDDWSIKHCDL